MDKGWIKLHRKLLRSAAWSDPSVGLIWINLLLRANWERRQLRSGEWLEPGELIISQDKFANDVGTTRKILRRALKDLENCGNLGQKRARHGTHITICNWTTYQDLETTEGQGRARQGPDKGQTRATEEEVKKLRKKEGKRHFVPPTVHEVADYCKLKEYTINPDKFIAYYKTRGWKLSRGQTMKDWHAACRTWQIRIDEESKPRVPTQPKKGDRIVF